VFIFKSIVGKLWMTIIGLVAVVMILLGSFLIPYVEKYFSEFKDQTISITTLAERISYLSTNRTSDEAFNLLTNELTSFNHAHLILVSRDMMETIYPIFEEKPILYRAIDFFSHEEIGQVFNGQVIDNSKYTQSPNRVSPHDQFVAVAVPVKSNNISYPDQIDHIAILYQPQQSYSVISSYVIRLFVYVAIGGLLLTTFFAFFLFYKITQPLQRLKKAAGLISMGELSIRVPNDSTDEIGDLAATFNRMAGELEETINAHSQEKEHLASVLRSMTDVVITFDADGSIILTNPQGNKLLKEWDSISNWSNQLHDGNSSFRQPDFKQIPDPLQPLFNQVLTSALEIQSNVHVRSDVWSVVMTPLYARDGVRGAVAVLRNVTEEFRLDKLRKDFVANVSHELRTPLSMLQGYSEALLDDIAGTPEERKELVQVIYDESLRMSRLVRDLLDLAKMEAGHLQMYYRETDLNALLKRINRKFSVLSKDQGITLVCEVDQTDLTLDYADEDRLEQVFTNLFDNALRHTHSGSSILMKAEKTMVDDTEGVLLIIADEGDGIPAEDLPYIFERFYKADKARTRHSTGGTGLGLAIVKNILDAHNGTVDVTSTIGVGTTFKIFLPNLQRETEEFE